MSVPIVEGAKVMSKDQIILPKMRDAKDRPVLRGARAAGADVLLTGDRDLLEADIEAPEIIDAATLLERLDDPNSLGT